LPAEQALGVVAAAQIGDETRRTLIPQNQLLNHE